MKAAAFKVGKSGGLAVSSSFEPELVVAATGCFSLDDAIVPEALNARLYPLAPEAERVAAGGREPVPSTRPHADCGNRGPRKRLLRLELLSTGWGQNPPCPPTKWAFSTR